MPTYPPITIRWSGTRFEKKNGAYTAVRTADAVGFATADDAIEAAFPLTPNPLPHPDNAAMFCMGRSASANKGPLAWIVEARYEFGDPNLCSSTPLSDNPTIMWDFGEEDPSAYDATFNAILNSAGDPFTPALTSPQTVPALVIQKYLPVFNVSVQLQYMNTTNSDTFTIAGAGSVSPGQAYCDYIKPVGKPYTLAAPYVQCEYRFTFKQGPNGFQNHVIDSGRNGWYTAGSGPAKKGPFCDASGNPVNCDVLLDGTGKPLNIGGIAAIKVLDVNGVAQTAVANPSLPAGLTIETAFSSATQKTLVWNDVPAVAFSGLV